MFTKILIANRGEIACRVIKTCRRLGIATVAVYSDADADAAHVLEADERVHLGPPPAAESYLLIDKIVDACKSSGADAVHPGYGFLSENPAFAEALAAAGITFIGPPKAAIEAMGDKITSKRIANEAGVSTVPGHPDAIADLDLAGRVAQDIGFPVMIKASAGGGGKGMRIVRDQANLQEGFKRAQSEARSSFGDDRVFIEKFIEQPRHIEIQVLADGHGNCVYLGERECSIQRRHQKVIEEAPSPFLDSATRKQMGEQAVALAQAVDYVSAGTVEFIVDADKNFYFLEMNTRLQVEHPVTELVTGLDLVEQMIRVAAGESLAFDQSQVELKGWAVEARVYAEDPARGFLPSTGRLVTVEWPEGDGIRIDTGVGEGDEVSMFYDPMIAKLCSFGDGREQALTRMGDALDRLAVRGLGNNVDFLNLLVRHPRFVSGDMSTNFIAEEFGDRVEPAELDPPTKLRFAVAGLCMALRQVSRDLQISGQIRGFVAEPGRFWAVEVGGEHFEVEVDIDDRGGHCLMINGAMHRASIDWRPGQYRPVLNLDGTRHSMQADPVSEGFIVREGGRAGHVLVRRQRAAELASRIPIKEPPDLSKMLISPMPGLILSVNVKTGDQVDAGQEILVLEAMKMENVLRAERSGTVETVSVKPGDTVSTDAVLVTFT